MVMLAVLPWPRHIRRKWHAKLFKTLWRELCRKSIYKCAYFKTIYTTFLITPHWRGSMKFSELTEDQWEYIKCFLPPQPSVGRKRADDRRTINGILYVLDTGCKWEDMPRRYGSYVTAWRRLRRWSDEGVWFKILCIICDIAYSAGSFCRYSSCR